jgi:hypothetical protein
MSIFLARVQENAQHVVKLKYVVGFEGDKEVAQQ